MASPRKRENDSRLVRQIVERLQHQHPEHQDGIERLPAGATLLELVRSEHHRLDLEKQLFFEVPISVKRGIPHENEMR